MKLIVLYGPPAVGKLTVAEDLARQTNFKLFHNHLTVDLLKCVLEFGTPEFFEINQEMKLAILEAAAKQGVDGVIHTFAYDHNTDNPFVSRLRRLCEQWHVDLRCVQLVCDRKELLERVEAESRKRFKKVSSADGLERYLATGNFFSSIDGVDSLRVDSTGLSPSETAELVMKALR